MSGWKLDKAASRYGYSEYPLFGFPETYNLSAVTRQVRKQFPTDRRTQNLQVSEMSAVPEFNVPNTRSVHFPDWSVEIRYVKE